MVRFKTGIAALALVMSAGYGALALAEPTPEDQIKYRQATMKAIGGHMGAIALIVQNKVDHRPQLLDHARALAATARHAADVFPATSAEGETAVKPEIWERPELFSKALEDNVAAADAFVTAVEGGDDAQIATRFKELGGTCKGCHDDFRQKK